jgi:hypothetical protein
VKEEPKVSDDGPIKVVNRSDTKLLFCDFNAGGSGVPFDATWVDPHSEGKLKVGAFKSLGVGVQAQKGGKWIGDDPVDPPYATPDCTFTFSISKACS